MALLIKDIPKDERPRERLIKYGKESLSNTELLSIILKTGLKGTSVTEVSTNLLNIVKKFENLKDVNIEVLKSIKGIGPAKSVEILASIELGRRLYLMKEKDSSMVFNNSKTIYELNKYLFNSKNQEYFYCLYLNSKKELIERKLLFMGTLNKSIVHPREIFKEAYMLSASSIICMHNHPSGDCSPSPEDIYLTKSLMEIGKLQQIPVIDHIIFGSDKYYSFYDNESFMRGIL